MTTWTQVGGGTGDLLKWETEGQSLEGIWQGTHDGQFGPLGTVEQPDGARVRFPLHTALLDRMQRISEGAEVRIIYRGKAKSKAGREFKAFDVFVSDPSMLREKPDETPPF